MGAGMLGMTLALRLAQAGKKVTLVEAAPSLGGLASSWSLGDVVWDRYYHVTLLSDTVLRELLDDLGLEAEIDWRTTKTNFYAGTDIYPLNNVFDYLKLPAMRFMDKIRMGATIVFASWRTNGVPLERYRVDDWLIRRSGKRTFNAIWRPLLRAKLGDNYKHASAAFIWSVIRRFYAARRGGMKTEMFGYVPGGYARVIDALSQKLTEAGVEILTAAPVSEIIHNEVGHEILAGEHRINCDRVAVCFAAPIASKVCQALQPAEKEKLSDIRYQGVICASVLLNRPLGGAYLTYITDESLPFTTVIEMSSLIDRKLIGGSHLVYLPKYVPSDDPWLEYEDSEIESQFRAGLQKMFPNLDSSDILAFQISRTRHVLALSTLNYSQLMPKMETSIPGLYLVNSAQIVNASLNVNDTVKLANESAEKLLAQN
ncbi:MAG: NAD(P)/FAD-dependent oxidoreductase [Halioglobus sp.]